MQPAQMEARSKVVACMAYLCSPFCRQQQADELDMSRSSCNPAHVKGMFAVVFVKLCSEVEAV